MGRFVLIPLTLILIIILAAACGEDQPSNPARATASDAATVIAKAGSRATELAQPRPTSRPVPTIASPLRPTVLAVATEPEPKQASIAVVEYHHYTDSQQRLIFVGLLTNTDTASAEDSAINIFLTDQSGYLVGFGYSDDLSSSSLPAGKSAGFSIIVDNPPREWAKEEFNISAYAYSPTDNNRPHHALDLSVVGNSLNLATVGSVVRGQVKNGGTKSTSLVQVNVTAYDSSGQVVDAGIGDAGDDKGIAPGQSATFEVVLLRQNVNIARYDLLISANEK